MKKIIIITIIILGIIFLSNKFDAKAATNVGANYGSVTNSTTDKVRLVANGLSLMPVRMHMFNATTTNSSSAFAILAQAKDWKTRGNYVICGVDLNGSAATTSVADFADDVPYWVNYVKNNGNCDEFQIGNEIALSLGAGYSNTQLIAALKVIATTAKALWATGTFSYSVEGNCGGGLGADPWISSGSLGSFDKIQLNTYGNIAGGGSSITWCGESRVRNAVSTFGVSRVGISEFNVDATDSNLQLVPEALKVAFTAKMISVFNQLGIQYATAYTYRRYLDSDTQFTIPDASNIPTAWWRKNVEKSEPNHSYVHNLGS